MRRSMIGVAVFALALSACSSGKKSEPAEGKTVTAEVAAKTAAAQIKLEPGEYESTIKVLDFDMPGMPAGQLDAMKSAMGGQMEKPHRYCLTPAEAAEGPKKMVSRMQRGDCTVSDFRSSANSVSGTMHCAFKGGAASTTKYEGTYASDGSTMTMESDQQMPRIPGKGMHMKMRVDTKRVGDCAA